MTDELLKAILDGDLDNIELYGGPDTYFIKNAETNEWLWTCRLDNGEPYELIDTLFEIAGLDVQAP